MERTVRLSSMIDRYGKGPVEDYLKRFRCAKDPDLQTFLHEKAVMYENKGRSRTFLMIDEDKAIRAYITLALTDIEVREDSPLSKGIRRKMDLNGNRAVGYLIGQMAKDDRVQEHIGHSLISKALRLLNVSYMMNGGRVVCVDCKKELLPFYQREGFVLIHTKPDEKNGLYRLILLF